MIAAEHAMSAVVDFPAKPEARPYLDAFRVDGSEPAWLAARRRRSLARFAEAGFPSRRGEAWRYLDLRGLADEPLLPARLDAVPPVAVDASGFPGAGWRLVIVDGWFAPELSTVEGLPAGLRLGPAAAAMAAPSEPVRHVLDGLEADPDQPFAALNGAFFTDGFVLDAAPGTVVEQPIEIIHIASDATARSMHTRSLVSLGEACRIRLCESYLGSGRYWRNDVVAVRLAAGAELDRVTLVEESDDAVHLAVLGAELAASARFDSFVLLLGGRRVRCEAHVKSIGERARCGLYGGFFASSRSEANIVTTVDHLALHGETRQIFKGVASGRGHGAFQGRITVHPGAQRIDAHMLSRNLALGAQAAIDTKPELEIYADDVKCSHGAAVGDLDAAALFYLMARGIPRPVARRILIEAFLREAVESVEPGPVREHLLAHLANRLEGLEESA